VRCSDDSGRHWCVSVPTFVEMLMFHVLYCALKGAWIETFDLWMTVVFENVDISCALHVFSN